METSTEQASAPNQDGTLPKLSLLSFSLGLALLLAVFLFLNPVWDAPDMGLWNENIWWSYVPIPLVVAVLLAWERKLRPATVLVETLKMTFVKFALTFLIAQVVWEVGGVPGTGRPDAGPVAVDAESAPYAVVPAPEPTPISAETTGRVTGRVIDASGEPVAGARVWIAAGLEEFVFPAPVQPALLDNTGAGFEPDQLVVHTYQRLELRNSDQQLHTAVIHDPAGKRLLNYPVLPGSERALMFQRAVGPVRLHCTGHGADESGVELLVLDSPFSMRTDASGAYAFDGVPAANLELSAGFGEPRVAVLLAPGATATVDIVLDYSR